MLRCRLATVAVALLAHPVAARAQASVPDTTATLRVRVVADSLPVAGARVRTERLSAFTGSDGVAELRVRAGRHLLVASRLGYIPDTIAIAVPAAGSDVTMNLTRRETTLEDVVVSATRSERRIEDTPLRVEVLGREEVEEKMLMTPGDITMMLNETGGLRVQTTSPSLGGANVRVQGMRGRYTLVLSDGLPLFGGQAGTLGLLQIPPMDLAQVEVVKGVASALYGSSAMGGVINLVSRRPREAAERELLLNQTTRGGSDAIVWASRQLSDALGYTLLAGGHHQRRVDVDRDGWTDLPGHERVVIRPRLFWTGERGRSLMATIGGTVEDRSGGTIGNATAPDGSPYREELRTRRFDGGAIARFPFGTSVLNARASVTSQGHRHHFGAVREQDQHATTFGELSLATSVGRHVTVVGAAFQRETYEATDVPRFDYVYHIPALFGQYDVDAGDALSFSASGRADFHNEYGPVFNPRVSVLYRFMKGWTARASAGTGAFAPTPLTEETEATGLTPLRVPEPLRVERATSGSVDAGGSFGALEVNVALFASNIAQPLLARASASEPLAIELFNASAPTRTSGADAMLRYRIGEITTTASYTFVKSREDDPDGGRRAVPLTPRHAAGLVSVWEREDKGRVGVEYYFTGRQGLDDNPYRTASRSYSVFGAIGEVHVGGARVFLNLENIGNVRLASYHPLLRPARGAGGRWTTDAWAPLEGRVINGGVRINLGAPSANLFGARRRKGCERCRQSIL